MTSVRPWILWLFSQLLFYLQQLSLMFTIFLKEKKNCLLSFLFSFFWSHAIGVFWRLRFRICLVFPLLLLFSLFINLSLTLFSTPFADYTILPLLFCQLFETNIPPFFSYWFIQVDLISQNCFGFIFLFYTWL